MSILCIDLKDNLLRASDGAESLQSCGYAFLRNPLEFGNEVRKQARLYPNEVNDQFWQDLNQSPAKFPVKTLGSLADLAWHQLGEIVENFSDPELVLVTPPHYSEAQLGLLLGIANSHQYKTRAIVARPLLLAAAAGIGKSHKFLEMQLHQLVITAISTSESGELLLGECEAVGGYGELALFDRIARDLQKLFVKTTRFDPLHNAHTEQQIFDKIPLWLEQLQDNHRISVEIEYRNQSYRAVFSRDQLVSATSSLVSRLFESVSGDSVIVTEPLLAWILRLHGKEISIASVVDSNAESAFDLISDQFENLPDASYLQSLMPIENPNRQPETTAARTEEQTNNNLEAELPASAANALESQSRHRTSEQETADSNSRFSDTATHLLCGGEARRGNLYISVKDGRIELQATPTELILGQIQVKDSGAILLITSSNDLLCNGSPLNQSKQLYAGDMLTYLPLGSTMLAIRVRQDET